eukprot:scaffold27027_cov79-Skeletonema_dohrnii-CCMP3373.AAC.1
MMPKLKQTRGKKPERKQPRRNPNIRTKPDYLSREIPQPPRQRKSPPKRIKQPTSKPTNKRQKIDVTPTTAVQQTSRPHRPHRKRTKPDYLSQQMSKPQEKKPKKYKIPKSQQRRPPKPEASQSRRLVTMKNFRRFTPTEHYDVKLNESWKELFRKKPKDTQYYISTIRSVEKIVKNTNTCQFKSKMKAYGRDLALLMLSGAEISTKVPRYFIKRSLTGQKTTDHNRQESYTVCFGDIASTEIPIAIGKDDQVIYKRAGDLLCNDMLHLAFKLVTPNIRNIGIVLLIIYQYRSKQHVSDVDRREMKRQPSSISLKRSDLPDLLRIVDEQMEICLPLHPQVTRNIWYTHSYAHTAFEKLIDDEPVLTYREAIRDEWRHVEGGVDLDRLDFFHLAFIMLCSQTEKDDDGISRLNRFVVSGKWVYPKVAVEDEEDDDVDNGKDDYGYSLGNSKFGRIGPKSFLHPLQSCNPTELLQWYESALHGRGLMIQRAATIIDLCVLCQTVWKREYPHIHSALMQIYQVSSKKSRVTLNGLGLTHGAGIDTHGVKAINAMLDHGNLGLTLVEFC